MQEIPTQKHEHTATISGAAGFITYLVATALGAKEGILTFLICYAVWYLLTALFFLLIARGKDKKKGTREDAQ